MAKNAVTHPASAQSAAEEPASSRPSLGPIIEINVRHIGRKPQPERPIGATAPEGWIKKVDRPREGKVWVGYFHLYVADSFGRPVRKKKEKTLGPATMVKHEAQQKLADYIEEFTGKLIHQGDTIESFADLWKAFSAVKAGSGPATAFAGLVGSGTPGQPTSADQVSCATSHQAFQGQALLLSVSVTWNPTIVIHIPASAVQGTYTGTVTHTVV